LQTTDVYLVTKVEGSFQKSTLEPVTMNVIIAITDIRNISESLCALFKC